MRPEMLPLADQEIYTLQYSASRGITLAFSIPSGAQ
jgi:hypothetical protein